MKKAITILAILIITISIGTFELLSVKNTLTSLEDMIWDFNQRYEINQDNITIFYDEIGDLKEYWEQKENWLCFIFNHRDLSTITDSINRLRAYTKNNDYDNAIAEIELLNGLTEKNTHILGFNIHNIL